MLHFKEEPTREEHTLAAASVLLKEQAKEIEALRREANIHSFYMDMIKRLDSRSTVMGEHSAYSYSRSLEDMAYRLHSERVSVKEGK